MSRVSPAPVERLAEFKAEFENSRTQRSYVPNSWYTLARRPRMFRAFRELRDAVMSERGKVPPDKLHALWQFTSSPQVSAAERAALNLAVAAGGCPPAVTDAYFAELKKHFSEDAIIEIVSVIELFGWINRWNDTLATQLEEHPLEFARKHLAASGWAPGVHAR